MALNDEVCIDASTSLRSMTTGHLLVTMPKLNASGLIEGSTAKQEVTEKPVAQGELKSAVNIRNIVADESEIPPLV